MTHSPTFFGVNHDNINEPLPQTMKTMLGASSGGLHTRVCLGYSRQIYAQARAGLPMRNGPPGPNKRTPGNAS